MYPQPTLPLKRHTNVHTNTHNVSHTDIYFSHSSCTVLGSNQPSVVHRYCQRFKPTFSRRPSLSAVQTNLQSSARRSAARWPLWGWPAAAIATSQRNEQRRNIAKSRQRTNDDDERRRTTTTNDDERRRTTTNDDDERRRRTTTTTLLAVALGCTEIRSE